MFATLRKILWVILFGIAAAYRIPSVLGQSDLPEAADTSSMGILLLAHGGNKEWSASVQAIAAEVGKTEPTEVALGMADRVSLQAGIDRLTA